MCECELLPEDLQGSFKHSCHAADRRSELLCELLSFAVPNEETTNNQNCKMLVFGDQESRTQRDSNPRPPGP